MKWVIALMLLGLAAAVQASPPPKGKTHHAKSVSTAKASTTKGQTSRSARGRYAKNSRTRRAPAPSYQTHPDPNRYQEIQKALTEKGYFKGEPNGQWNSDSVDALKRFQADQRLDTDGKINARTLFGLGLGPKHDGRSVASAVVPPETVPAATATPQ